MRFLLLTGLLWVGAAFPGHIVASVAAAGAPPLPHTVYPHWAALQGQHGSFQYMNPFVLDIPPKSGTLLLPQCGHPFGTI